ncbi:MAG: hypothetical protein ACK5VI_04330 [Opitutia bacterium]|jgi:hypothetical protein
MSYKYDPSAFNDTVYVKEEGKFPFHVKSVEFTFTPTAVLIAKMILEREDGAVTTSKLFGKPEKSGQWTRLNQFIGSTSTKAEIEGLLAKGEFDITDDFIKSVCERSVGRRLMGEVRKEEYTKRDGTPGVAYSVSFYRPHAEGPVHADGPF